MADITFSWSDTVRAAVGSCLPCLATTGAIALPTNTNTNNDDSDTDSLVNSNPHDPARNRLRMTRADELQGLLADADLRDDDDEADALSLHSNIGRGSGRGSGRKRLRQKKKKKGGAHDRRSLSIWGFNLFGRHAPSASGSEGRIRLPEDGESGTEGEHDSDPIRRILGPSPTASSLGTGSRRTNRDDGESNSTTTTTTNGGSTTAPYSNRQNGRGRGRDDTQGTRPPSGFFDPDALPLDSATLDNMTPDQMAEYVRKVQIEQEEEEMRKNEERRKRKERKDSERAHHLNAEGAGGNARVLRAALASGEDFEGFQGSGDGLLSSPIPPGFFNQSNHLPEGEEEFGEFVRVTGKKGDPVAADGEDEADLDGALYNRTPRGPVGIGGSRGSSDSRSRTSPSLSQASGPVAYSHNYSYHNPQSLIQQHQHARVRAGSRSTGAGRSSGGSQPSQPGTLSPTPKLGGAMDPYTAGAPAGFPDLTRAKKGKKARSRSSVSGVTVSSATSSSRVTSGPSSPLPPIASSAPIEEGPLSTPIKGKSRKHRANTHQANLSISQSTNVTNTTATTLSSESLASPTSESSAAAGGGGGFVYADEQAVTSPTYSVYAPSPGFGGKQYKQQYFVYDQMQHPAAFEPSLDLEAPPSAKKNKRAKPRGNSVGKGSTAAGSSTRGDGDGDGNGDEFEQDMERQLEEQFLKQMQLPRSAAPLAAAEEARDEQELGAGSAFPSTGFGKPQGGGFPSTMIKGGGSGVKRDIGAAFLARRGGDD